VTEAPSLQPGAPADADANESTKPTRGDQRVMSEPSCGPFYMK